MVALFLSIQGNKTSSFDSDEKAIKLEENYEKRGED